MKTIYKILTISLLTGYIFNHAYAEPANSLVDADFDYQNEGEFTVTFSPASDVSPGDIKNYTWTIEDSTITATNSINYTFPDKGYYNVCFTTLDTNNVKDTRCKTIHVTDDSPFIQSNSIDFSYYVDTMNQKIELYLGDELGEYGQDLAIFWNFDNTVTATGPYPAFNYDVPGVYTVTMTIKDSVSSITPKNYTVTKKIIAGTPPCNAHFNLWVSEDTAQFINHSSANTTKFFWSFGDGTFSDAEHPEHIYKNNGIYEIKLVAFDPNSQCLDSYTEKIRIGKKINCHADFDYYVDSTLMDVHFENTSLGNPQNHVWIFGDGTISHDFSPMKGFNKPGYYSARLIVSNTSPDFCIDQVKKNILISRTGDDVEAEFFYHVSGKKISLLNKSVGEDLIYTWNFGDFDPENYRKDSVSKSLVMNPQFTYSKEGYYNVCLTAHSRKTGTSDLKCKKIKIGTPAKDCKANLIYALNDDDGAYSVRFLDRSFSHGIIDKRTWSINDTTFEDIIGDIYYLPDTGLYTLKLQIEDNLGCISRDYALINAGIEGKLYGAYDFNIIDTITFKATGYPVDFVGISHGDAAKLKWDFDGDGTWDDSTSSNPTYVYTAPGEYYCKLQVSDPNTGDVDTYIDTVNVGEGLGINNPDNANNNPELIVSPNPVATSAQIKYTLQKQSNVNITLFDLKGNSLINLVNTEKPKGSHQVILNKGNLKTGIYYLQIKTNKGVAGKKIIMIK
ncbi:MAG: PKD domain-containing protein [Bacteroidota bacterium]